MATLHEPTDVIVDGEFSRQGGQNQRKWAVWYLRLRCPVCGQEFTHLKNTIKNRQLQCIGLDRLRTIKKGK